VNFGGSGLVVAATSLLIALTACSSDDSQSAAAHSPVPTTQTQKVSGQFSIHDINWIRLIPGTSWNRCNGEPECDGQECYGAGAANGLGSDTEVLVTNGTGDKVARGEVGKTWGWKHGARGACVLYWSVRVPVDQTGVLTATFAGNSQWAPNFTLAKMRKLPHALDFISIG
jgi:hypothetical protein